MTVVNWPNKTGKRCGRHQRAFTIVEVIVAAVLATLIFLAVYASINQSYSILTVTRQNMRATQIMVSRLEGLRLEAWSSSTNELAELFNTNYVPAVFSDEFYPQGLSGTNNPGITYYGTMTVVQLFNNPTAQANVYGGTVPSYATNMALVTVNLTWTNSAIGDADPAGSHTRTMSTLVCAYGLQNYIFDSGTH